MIGGVGLFAWIEMFNQYKTMNSWPDGQSHLQQPAVAVEIFAVIESQIERVKKQDKDASSG